MRVDSYPNFSIPFTNDFTSSPYYLSHNSHLNLGWFLYPFSVNPPPIPSTCNELIWGSKSGTEFLIMPGGGSLRTKGLIC